MLVGTDSASTYSSGLAGNQSDHARFAQKQLAMRLSTLCRASTTQQSPTQIEAEMSNTTARVAHEDSPLFGEDGAFPKAIYANISGVGIRLGGAKSRFNGSEQIFYTRTHEHNEELPGYNFSVTVFTPDSVGHLRNKATLSVTTNSGKHLNRRYDIDALQMRLRSFESFIGDKFEELIAELDQVDQTERTSAMTTVRRALTEAGYNLNVHHPAMSGKYKLSCSFQVPANGQIYVLQLDLTNPYVRFGTEGHCLSIKKANGTSVISFGARTKEFPEERKLKFYLERLLNAFRNKLGLGLPPALAAVALAIGRANHEHKGTLPIAQYDREDISSVIYAFNNREYNFVLVRYDEIELRYSLQLGSKTVTMSISDEDSSKGRGYTVLLFPSAFDTFKTQRVDVKIFDLDLANLRKAAEATLELWYKRFNEDLPAHQHVKIHGRVSHEPGLKKICSVKELPSVIKLERFDLVLIKFITHGDSEIAKYSSKDEQYKVDFQFSDLGLEIGFSTGYLTRNFGALADNDGFVSIAVVVKLLNEEARRRDSRVHARVSHEQGSTKFTELEELPKTIKLKDTKLVFDEAEKINSVGDGTHSNSWCYYNSPKNEYSVELTVEKRGGPSLKDKLSMRIYLNGDKFQVPVKRGYIIGHVVIDPGRDGYYDLKAVIRKLDEYIPERNVEARVASEDYIKETTDLPNTIMIGKRIFKKSKWEPEQGSGVKARWFEQQISPYPSGALPRPDGTLTWVHNDIEFRNDMMGNVDIRINVRRAKLRSAEQLATMIQQKLSGRRK